MSPQQIELKKVFFCSTEYFSFQAMLTALIKTSKQPANIIQMGKEGCTGHISLFTDHAPNPIKRIETKLVRKRISLCSILVIAVDLTHNYSY